MTPFGIKLKYIRTQRHKSLKDLSKLVIYYTHASPKDGGYGAYYIRLRKIFK